MSFVSLFNKRHNTRGVQKVRRLTQLTTRYANHILLLFNIDTLLTVQNPTKTVYFKMCSRCPPPQLSHKLEVFWQSSIWPCWWSSVADHPILFARLSSARRWYLAWV